MPLETKIDPRELRDVLGSFVTGVTIITTLDEDGTPHGLTANSFSSVSLDPPLVLWSQAVSAPSHPVFRNSDRFSVSILAQDQIDLSNKFARSAAGPGQSKFDGVKLRKGLGGVPLIEDCAASLECRLIAVYPGGDHVVYLGQVDRIERSNRPPLGFYGGRYVVPFPHDQSTAPDASVAASLAALQAQRIATKGIIELSDQFDRTIGIGVWGNYGPTIVRWEESRSPVTINFRTGYVLPTLKSATGLLFSAFLPKNLVVESLQKEFALLDLPGEAALSALEQVEPMLATIRKEEMVFLANTTDFQDAYGTKISAVACPVFDREGQMLLAVTSVGPPASSEADEQEFHEAMKALARGVSAALAA